MESFIEAYRGIRGWARCIYCRQWCWRIIQHTAFDRWFGFYVKWRRINNCKWICKAVKKNLIKFLPLLSDFTTLISNCSGKIFEKSTSYCASSRFKKSMRFCAAIFSFANLSISCSYSRSFRLRNCWLINVIYMLWNLHSSCMRIYLNMSNCCS